MICLLWLCPRIIASYFILRSLKYCCWYFFILSFNRFVATSGFTPDVKVWEVKFSRSGDFEKAARAFDLTGVSSCIDFHSHRKLLLRPQEWRLQLRFQCWQWENGDGQIIPHLVILFLVQVSKDGSWKVFDTAIQFSRGQDAEVEFWKLFKMLYIVIISFKGAGNWLLPLGQQPAQSDITLSRWPCCSHCTGGLPELLKNTSSPWLVGCPIKKINF